jgi:hypothetical protein
MNSDQLNTKNDLLKPLRPKETYVILPCHPFYGLKVEILQRGKTDTQEWCLIKHPEQQGFHYRIPARWLDNELPKEILPLTYQNNIIAFPFIQLQKLALFVNSKLQNTLFVSANQDTISYGKPQIISESKLDDTEHREGSADLEQNPSGAKNKTLFKASVDIDINKQKE